MTQQAAATQPVDTYSEEYRLDCLARYLIRNIRGAGSQYDRRQKFRRMTKKYPQRLQDDLTNRVRRLWEETNAADRKARS